MRFALHLIHDPTAQKSRRFSPCEFMLDLSERLKKESPVASVLINKASELKPQTRAALEAELGRRLQDNKQVSIMVFVLHEAPGGKARRQAGRRLEEPLNRIDEKTQGVPEAEMEAAIDAVAQWEYTPTLVNGVAVPVIMTVPVSSMP